MSIIKYIFIFSSGIVSCLAQNKENPLNKTLELEDRAYQELSLSEWKKFKSFKQRLEVAKSNNKEEQLRNYTRDSIQILEVKLMAVKLLREKKLLDKDISENREYYAALLDELRESVIPESEYLFLEEKLAYLNQSQIQNDLKFSKWLNIGLLLFCILLCVIVYLMKKKAMAAPLLSKQEITVRNLILQGKTNKEIADELFISLSTVKTHITNLYSKLNVANRQELFLKSTGTST